MVYRGSCREGVNTGLAALAYNCFLGLRSRTWLEVPL